MDENIQTARKTYPFAIGASLVVALIAFVYTLITIGFVAALVVSGFVIFFGVVMYHPRVIEEMEKMEVPESRDAFGKRVRDEDHRRRTSPAYQHLSGNSFHGSYLRNYHPEVFGTTYRNHH